MRIGIDLGGTKIEGIALDRDGTERVRSRIPAPRPSAGSGGPSDYLRTLAAIVELVGDIEQRAAERGSVGIGMPGTISPATGRVKNANSTWLNGQPLADDLRKLLGRPVRFANDANCFALSEATDGAAAGAHVVFGVIVGTGTGGGVVVAGRVVTGANAIGGEWGHNPLPAPRLDGGYDERPGPPCYCGRSGCIETFLSGPALARDYADAGGDRLEGDAIDARARSGEACAIACLDRYADRMARALASVINVIDPDVIVLGGGLSNIDRLYELVPARWTPHIFSDRVVTRLVRAKHGDASGVRGAAWLWDV
ncbi:MAG TPA: ROK family protein [Vicinamibacterales bacterium]|nr:ROK family protein [Vicinamibacterales bacterium]